MIHKASAKVILPALVNAVYAHELRTKGIDVKSNNINVLECLKVGPVWVTPMVKVMCFNREFPSIGDCSVVSFSRYSHVEGDHRTFAQCVVNRDDVSIQDVLCRMIECAEPNKFHTFFNTNVETCGEFMDDVVNGIVGRYKRFCDNDSEIPPTALFDIKSGFKVKPDMYAYFSEGRFYLVPCSPNAADKRLWSYDDIKHMVGI